MIRPPGFSGVLFGTAAEGDARTDEAARRDFERHGVPHDWAYVTQVHGDRVVEALRAGRIGEADAIYTTIPGLAITVATADCVPVAIEGNGFVSVVHAGWRGVAVGTVTAALTVLRRRGLVPERAAIGPSIGPCCYEVGAEVRERLPAYHATTSWGTDSVDLASAVVDQLGGLPTWSIDRCTMTDEDLFSYRRNRTLDRQVCVAWVPAG
jgi:YfiH family protein